MAHIETLYRCICCNALYSTRKDAISCASSHVISEKWAVGKFKSVRIFGNCAPNSFYGINWALREADLSDDIDERRRQLADQLAERSIKMLYDTS